MPYSQEDSNVSKILDTLKQGGYIKGHGKDNYRLMTHDHSPLFNFGKDYFVRIKDQLEVKGLVHVLITK